MEATTSERTLFLSFNPSPEVTAGRACPRALRSVEIGNGLLKKRPARGVFDLLLRTGFW